jgi:hypothetical protein
MPRTSPPEKKHNPSEGFMLWRDAVDMFYLKMIEKQPKRSTLRGGKVYKFRFSTPTFENLDR